MKSIHILLIYAFILCFFYFGYYSRAISIENSSNVISEYDLKVIEKGDYNAAAGVLYRMQQLYKKEGKKSIIPAIQALIKRTLKDINNLGKLGEGEGEFLGDLLWALSVTGDERVKPVLMKAMVSNKVYSWDIPRGFLNIGHSTLPEILDSLKSINDDIKRVSALTLAKMGEFDSTGTFFTEKDRKVIKEQMLELIKDKNENMRIRAVMALGYFGDKSSISILTEIKDNDPFRAKNGRYFVRMEAEKSIERLMKQ